MGKKAGVLSGGGAHGSFQVGVLSVLGERKKLNHHIWRGTSVGAVNGAFMYSPLDEQNQRAMQLPEIWKKEVHGNDSIYRMRFGGIVGSVISGKQALADTSPLLSILKKYWKGPVPGVSLGVTAVDEISGKVMEFFENDPDMTQKILASASFPGVFDPVIHDERNNAGIRLKTSVFTDGGVRDIVPHRSVIINTEVDEIDVIVCKPVNGGVLPQSPGKTYSILDRMLRTVEIMADELYLGDIRELQNWANTPGKILRIWAPAAPIETDPLDFRPSFQSLLIERGRDIARAILEK